jgi:hypothetical protein
VRIIGRSPIGFFLLNIFAGSGDREKQEDKSRKHEKAPCQNHRFQGLYEHIVLFFRAFVLSYFRAFVMKSDCGSAALGIGERNNPRSVVGPSTYHKRQP